MKADRSDRRTGRSRQSSERDADPQINFDDVDLDDADDGDMLWAPISGLIFMKTFGGMTGVIGGIANMAEELIPFTDFIPTFTIGYFYTKYQLNKASKK